MANIIPFARTSPPSWLLCCELQWSTERRSGPENGALVANVARLLNYARKHNWIVAHIVERGATEELRPIEGLEPLCSEAVFPRAGLSAFSHDALRQGAMSSRDATFHIAGFGLGRTILTTLIVGREHGLDMVFAEDAVATSSPDVNVRTTLLGLARSVAASRTVAQIESF